MKTQKNFRLSDSALANLAAIVTASGCNETAAVEMALAALAKGLTGENTMPRTIETKFDPTLLPRWAQNDKNVVALAKRSLSFRTNVHDAKTPAAKRLLKREASQFDPVTGEYEGNTTEDSGYADNSAKFYELNK